MRTEFYFEIQQYFNFDWKITITLIRSHRNTQQRQILGVTASVGKTPPYNLKICRHKKKLSYARPTPWQCGTEFYWILLKLKHILKFMICTEF